MPIATLNPNGNDATYTQWTLLGGAGSKWSALQDAVDGNYIWADSAGPANYYAATMEDLPTDAVDILSVDPIWRLGRSTSGPSARGLFCTVGGAPAQYATGENFSNNFPANWANIQGNVPLNPTGGAWSVADINNLRVGVGEDGTGTPTVRCHCTKMEAEIDYVPAGGGFAFLIAQWILPLLGAAIPFSSMREISRMVKLSGGPLIKTSEFERAWRELVTHPWRVSCA